MIHLCALSLSLNFVFPYPLASLSFFPLIPLFYLSFVFGGGMLIVVVVLAMEVGDGGSKDNDINVDGGDHDDHHTC